MLVFLFIRSGLNFELYFNVLSVFQLGDLVSIVCLFTARIVV